MLMLRRRVATVVPRTACRLLVGFMASLLVLTLLPAAASARVRTVSGDGSVSCSLSATIRFSPPITRTGGGTRSSAIKAALVSCKTYGKYGTYNTTEQVSEGLFKGDFARSPISCATLTQTSAPISGGTKWAKGYSRGQLVKFDNSGIQNNIVGNGSFTGTARVVLDVPAWLASQCDSGNGVRSATITGTFTLGPSCGPGSGAITIYPIAPGPMCGGIYQPFEITAGSDGAMWFTNSETSSIGRISSSGTVTLYSLPDGAQAD